MDRLKKYDFLDENGHRLEDCADYQAIFSEHEAELARVKAAGIEALRRAEQAEARAEKAESNVARLTKERKWLLSLPVFLGVCPNDVDKRTSCLYQCKSCWAEATSRAVDESEVKG